MHAVYDELFANAEPLIRAGTHRREGVPREGGRWPATIVLRITQPAVSLFDELSIEAAALAGPGHYRTGRPDAVHMTIRSLEQRREAAKPTDPFLRRCAEALHRAAATTAPLRFTYTGLTLAAGTVMAQLEPVDDQPWSFADRVALELGDDGWHERQWPARNIFYASLLHLAADIRHPERLVQWVRDRRTVEPVEVVVDTTELVRFDVEHNGDEQYFRVDTWYSFPFTGAGGMLTPT